MANLVLNSAIFLTLTIYFARGSLVHLGDIEGKAYYEENSVHLNWTQAYSYCVENGMHLAKIESTNQADFLARVVGEIVPYWISSKTTDNPTKYSWNSQGVNLTYSVIWTDSGDADVNDGCAYFELYSLLGGLEFFHWICDNDYPITLCEDDSNSKLNSLPIKRPQKVKKEKEEGLHQNLNFTHLGDVENKAFYLFESGQGVNWEQAYSYCYEGNMTLARIESDIQANFLAERLEEETEYWIGINNVDLLTRRRTYNMTGAYMQMDLAWAQNGRVDDPFLGCGEFGYFHQLNSKVPTVILVGCYLEGFSFLCHVDL